MPFSTKRRNSENRNTPEMTADTNRTPTTANLIEWWKGGQAVGIDSDGPTPLYVDNKSAVDLSYNPEHHSRVKHIERRHFFIRECVEDGRLRVPYVPTEDNVADFFTKPLTGKHFFNMRDKVMNVQHPLHSSEDRPSSPRPSSPTPLMANA